MTSLARRAAKALLRSSTVNGAVRTLARLRGHRLVLVYHRLGPSPPPGCEIVPTVPIQVFRSQLEVLGEVVDLVSLDAILATDGPGRKTGSSGRGPQVAVTFDDDLPSHADQALPVLLEFGVPAAFFLSGRALHGCGPYWFQHLEALLEAHGGPHTATLLDLPEARVGDLALECERNPTLRRKVSERASSLPVPEILNHGGIAALASARMTIGFHTVDHEAIPRLDDAALDDALSRGRQELAAVTGGPVNYFAYPYGKADARSAAAVRRFGFGAAFTGRPQPLRRGDDRHRLGRWEPGRLQGEDLLVALAVRLHRAGPRSPGRPVSWT